MVKEGYKEITALGEEHIIPEEWNLTELNEVLTVIRNGSSKKQNKQGQGLPVSRIETIADGTINYDKVGYVDVEPEDLNKHELEKGDILFSHINSIAHIGKVAQYKADKKLYHGMNLLKLRFDNKKVTNQFMLYRLKSTNAKHFYERYAKQAVNQASLNQSDVGLYTFPLPSLSEQKKISSILSSVYKSIKKTDEVIEKTKELKKGLIQELFIKGIRHNEFKETVLGPQEFFIPKTWKVICLENLTTLIKDGTHNPPERVDEGIPLLSATNIENGRLNFDKTDNFIREEDYEDMHKKYTLETGDVLLTCVGTLGRTTVIKKKTPKFTVQRSVAIFKLNDLIESEYCYYAFQSHYFQEAMKRRSNATAQAGVYLNELSKMQLFIPPLEEQKQIASILSSMDAKIKKEEEYKAKLERLKKGLMQKLLTGEIRVNTEMEV